MKINLSFLAVFIFLHLSNIAKSQNISGQVVDSENGNPLIGAILRNLNTNSGTSTDVEGKFSIEANDGDEISISYVGYENQSLVVGENDFTMISLSLDQSTLEEVVVIGYGSQKRSEITGAVSMVDEETIDNIKPINAQEALQGTTPGVLVTPQSGAPGAGFNIRIRGVGTNGNASPLVIIDGYEGDINLLNPADIESFSILKDAQAAVYGARGANGVIFITTKQGKKNQKPTISIDSYYGLQETSRKLNLLDPVEYAVLLNESYAATGKELPYPNIQNVPIGSDWQDEVFGRNVPMLNNSLRVTGGGENVTYNVGGSFLKQDGIIGGGKSGFYRGTGRASVNVDLSEKLKMQTNFIYTSLNRKSVNDFALGSVLFNALNAPPTLSAIDENGEYTLIPSTTGLGIEVINPLAQVANTYNDFDLRKLNGTFRTDYELIDGLTLTGRFGFNTTNQESRGFAPIVNYGGKVFDNSRSRVDQNTQNYNDYTLDLFATWEKQFSEKHNLTATGALTFNKEYGDGVYATGYDVPGNSWEYAYIHLATGPSETRDVGSFVFDERLAGQVGRVLYNFDNRYHLMAQVRRDLSTKFSPRNKDAIFSAFSSGWTISNEPFFTSEIVDLLKLRASYGQLGNDRIGNLLYFGSLNPQGGKYLFDDSIVTGRAPGTLPNPDVQWEAEEKIDVGFDFEFLNNKINIVADFYQNSRNELLLSNTPVSGITGIAAPGSGKPTVNVGGVENSGFEFAIGYKGSVQDKFHYNLSYNLGTVKNEVTYVSGDNTFIEGGSFGVGNPLAARMQVGQPMGAYFGYETNGIFQNQSEIDAHATQSSGGVLASPGDLRYVDQNEDGVIDLNDRVFLGSPIPEVNMGLNIQTEYKNFDLLVYTYAAMGHELVRDYERTLSDVNQLNYRINRWTGEGSSTSVPRVTAGANGNTVFSDFYVEDGSFLRIQTAQIGYTFPKSISEQLKMNSARLYVKGNNLLTFSDYIGYDPSASSGAPIGSGFDKGFYPQARILILGASLNF